MKTLVDNYTDNELKQIVKMSKSYINLAKKIGYTSFSGNLKIFLEERFSQFDTSHFNKKSEVNKRNFEDVFIENSTVDQSTLRRWYLKGEYTPYTFRFNNPNTTDGTIVFERYLIPIVWFNLEEINYINAKLADIRCDNCGKSLMVFG